MKRILTKTVIQRLDSDIFMLLLHYEMRFFKLSNTMQVASTRPIQFSEDAVIFELRDGRVSVIYFNQL